MISLKKLRHIVAIDRAGSITGAANALNITQSSVTKNLAEIERQVGFSLFDRKARGVVTTAEGREFIDRAARILSDIDILVTDAQQANEAREAILRVGVCPPSIEGLLNRALKKFILKNPKLRIHLASVTIERGLNILRRGDVDVLVAPEYIFAGNSGFAVESLGKLNASLFCRKNHPLAKQKNVSTFDLIDYSIITPDVAGIYTDSLRELYISRGKDPERQLFIIENFPMVAEIVEASDLLATVSHGYADSKAFRGRFACLDVDLFEPMALCYGYQSGQPPRHNLQTFLAALQQDPPN